MDLEAEIETEQREVLELFGQQPQKSPDKPTLTEFAPKARFASDSPLEESGESGANPFPIVHGGGAPDRRRCLLPVDNFYEWAKTAAEKQPYADRAGRPEPDGADGLVGKLALAGRRMDAQFRYVRAAA
jgi:hypothetical protein